MNNDFNSWYLALLKKQVQEEIDFLIKNGHDSDRIKVPCMFCINTQQGYYRCSRLGELRRFSYSVASHIGKSRDKQPDRVVIGSESPIQFEDLGQPIFQMI